MGLFKKKEQPGKTGAQEQPPKAQFKKTFPAEIEFMGAKLALQPIREDRVSEDYQLVQYLNNETGAAINFHWQNEHFDPKSDRPIGQISVHGGKGKDLNVVFDVTIWNSTPFDYSRKSGFYVVTVPSSFTTAGIKVENSYDTRCKAFASSAELHFDSPEALKNGFKRYEENAQKIVDAYNLVEFDKGEMNANVRSIFESLFKNELEKLRKEREKAGHGTSQG